MAATKAFFILLSLIVQTITLKPIKIVQPKIIENENKGAAILEVEGNKIAEMTYSRATPNLVIIDHTEVNEKYQGEGLGRKLLDAIVAKARRDKFKILPLCPYAKSEFVKDASIKDVLK